MDFGMTGDPLKPETLKCKHGVWMMSLPNDYSRISYCPDCNQEQREEAVNEHKK